MPESLAFGDDHRSPLTGSVGAQESPSTSSLTTVPAGISGDGTPATTVPGVPRVNPDGPYSGFLGTIGIDDELFGAPAAAPVAEPGTAPLTGLPGTVSSGPAVVVKVDNSSKARPQLGLNAADIVVEEQVEGGITRLAAIFHTQTSVVGPVRSGRTTDISFINALGGPALVYSGANDVIDALLLRQTTVQNYSAARSSGYWRDRSRRAPSNLFTDTASFDGSGSAPPAQFAYRATGSAPVNPAIDATAVAVTFPSTSVRWRWDGSSWLRTQNGTAHVTDGGQQVAAANVVVAIVPEVLTGLVDSAGFPVPEYVFAGSGPVSVFTGGKRIDGTWTRPSLRSPAILVDGSGTVIELAPGRTWIELVVAGGYSSS